MKLNSNNDFFLGKDTIEMQHNVLKPGTKVLLLDDILATGGQFVLFIIKSYFKKFFLFFKGTLGAAQKLCVELGCEVVETLVIIELVALSGRKRLADVDHFVALFQFSEADFEEMATKPNQVHQPKDA